MKTLAESPVSVSRTFHNVPDIARAYGYPDARLVVTAKAYQVAGNAHPHFSVTASVYSHAYYAKTRDSLAGGCLHDEAARHWPAIIPIIALHLSAADTGEPMHAEENGYYWLAGMVGGLGEQYHGGSGSDGKTREECTAILADHLRIHAEEAGKLADKVAAVYNAPIPEGEPRTSKELARAAFRAFVDAQRPRWAREAEAGLALIRRLAASATE